MANPEEMAQSMRNNIEAKTGKPLSYWFEIIATSTLEKHGQIVKFLKSDFAITHGFANLITSDYLSRDQDNVEDIDLITAQYSGAKRGLKPIYDALIAQMKSLPELEIAPKKAYVSLRRSKQFAIIQPSTKTRVDIGINLKGEPETTRLELSGSFNSMVSHRVRISDTSQVDDELIGWLKQAYNKS